jgi:hypothetical protein
MEISVRVDGSMEWNDEYAMGWCSLLAKGRSYFEQFGLPGTHTLSQD